MQSDQQQDLSTDGIELSEKYTLKNLKEEYFVLLPGIAFCVLGKEILRPLEIVAQNSGKIMPVRYVTYQKDFVTGLSPIQANRMLFAIPQDFGPALFAHLKSGVAFTNPETKQVCRLLLTSIKTTESDSVLGGEEILALETEFPEFAYRYVPPVFSDLPWTLMQETAFNEEVAALQERANQLVTEAKES